VRQRVALCATTAVVALTEDSVVAPVLVWALPDDDEVASRIRSDGRKPPVPRRKRAHGELVPLCHPAAVVALTEDSLGTAVLIKAVPDNHKVSMVGRRHGT